MILPNFQQIQDKHLGNKLREQVNSLEKTQNKEQVDLFRMTHTRFICDVLEDCDNFDELRKDIDNRYDNMIAALCGDIITTGH